jgi:3'-phosphoadenosine 5'-phosphosulfate sulfotransferase (PAPS reductase)/FAD synthetase
MDQFSLFDGDDLPDRRIDVIDVGQPGPIVRASGVDGLESPDLSTYDDVIVAFSGGKDSVACVLALLDQGVRPELWHHDIDGHGEDAFFDWPVTPAYCDAFAAAFGLPIYHSWRVGGLKRELLKENARLAPAMFETPDGVGSAGGERGKISTRLRWPALGADLMTRWCSSVGKIDVFAAAVAGQQRFRGRRVLVVTGERAQESASRSKYATFEPHRNHAPGPIARRTVHHWRPIHGWTEQQVWDIIARHRVNPHPCYHLGWSRASCQFCIFSGKSHLATLRRMVPERFREFRDLEKRFGHTIRRGATIDQTADDGVAFDLDPRMVEIALSSEYREPVVVDDWELPRGAFGENAGPI